MAKRDLTGISVSATKLRRHRQRLNVSAVVVGDKDLARRITELEPRIFRRVMKPAFSYGLTPALRAARRNAPVESGLLKSAIKKKVARTGRWGKVYVDPKVRGMVRSRIRRPSKYAHLQEFGWGKNKSRTRNPFLIDSVKRARSEIITRITVKARQRFEIEMKRAR